MTLIGYARVSTDDQDLSLQLDALERAGVEQRRVYTDKKSASVARPGLDEALRALRPGDQLVVWRLDRLARSVRDLEDLASRLEGEGVELRALQEAIDTSTAAGKFFFHVMGALSEFERNLIRERTNAGLQAARKRGRKPGRRRSLSEADIRKGKAMLADPSLTVREVREALGVSEGTFYAYFPGGRSGLSERSE
jgi:DNA invertase Pin-like site-specific DNA recombinase